VVGIADGDTITRVVGAVASWCRGFLAEHLDWPKGSLQSDGSSRPKRASNGEPLC
jgi:hypothetical protein